MSAWGRLQGTLLLTHEGSRMIELVYLEMCRSAKRKRRRGEDPANFEKEKILRVRRKKTDVSLEGYT